MKWLEHEMPGFRIIFLHDPFSCYKCIDVMTCDDFDNTLNKYIPQTKFGKYKKLCKSFESKNVPQKRKEESHLHSKYEFHPLKEYTSTNIKMLKTKNMKGSYYKKSPISCKKSQPLKHSKKSPKKKKADGSTELITVKKQACNTDKLKDSKVPGKGTLKRKRWFLNKLNCSNDDYEDDLFEDQKFAHFQSLFEDETDSAENYEELKTPQFPISLSPREKTPSPTYKDCYNPAELSRCRKGAEEYQYRRRRRRKLCFADDKTDSPHVDPERREADVQKRLEEVARILDQQRKNASDSEDDYFSDLLDNSSKVIP